jgi:small-conductance mechanosensitive channel
MPNLRKTFLLFAFSFFLPSAFAAGPVTAGNRALFSIQARIGSFSPEQRAVAITQRLNQLVERSSVDVDQIQVQELPETTDIVLDDQILVSITDADAKLIGETRSQVGEKWRLEIVNGVREERASRSSRNFALHLGLAFGFTIALFIIFFILRKSFERAYAFIDGGLGGIIRSIHFRNLEVLRADRVTRSLFGIARIARAFVTFFVLYLYFPLVLGLFPQTERWAERLYGYILTPLKTAGRVVEDFIPNLFFILVICMIGRFLLKFVRLFFNELGAGNIQFSGFHREWAEPTYKLVRIMVFAFLLVVIFPYLPGSGSPAFQGISVFFGVLLSLGSTSSIANVVAGIVITYMRPFKLGDRVKISETTGDVIEKSLLVTRVRTIKNVDVTIPNSIVLGSHITNYSAVTEPSVSGLILHTTVTIGYDSPWKKVHELLISAARATPDIEAEPSPFVFQTSLDDFYVSYEINAYTRRPSAMARIYSDLHQNIQDSFNQGGVEIMSPHYGSLRDGNETTIPTEGRSTPTKSPRFNISVFQDQRN